MGSQRLDFAEFYRGARDECLRTVLVSVGDYDAAQELVDEAFAASVVFGNPMNVQQKPCQWYHGNVSGLLSKVVPSIAPGPGHAILAIRPSALPAGAGVQIITMTNLSRIGVRLVSTSQGCTGS